MSAIRNVMRKAAGLFVEFDEDGLPAATPALDPASAPLAPSAPAAPSPRAKTVEEIVAATPGPKLEQVNAPATPVETKPERPVFLPDGRIDFEAIYELAGLTPAAFGADQVLELLGQLPAELPLEAKRATLKVTLGAMAKTSGVSSDTVVGDAMRKLAALATYSENFEKQADEYCTRAEARIAELRAEAQRIEAGIADAKLKAQTVEQACVKESERIDDVLEFFSLDVPPSKHAT